MNKIFINGIIVVRCNLKFCEKILKYAKTFKLQKICSLEEKTNPKFGFSAPKSVNEQVLELMEQKFCFPELSLFSQNFKFSFSFVVAHMHISKNAKIK